MRDDLKKKIKICLVKNGYPPQYTPEVFREVMDQVENFKENENVGIRKLENIEDDRDVRNLIYQRLLMNPNISDADLQSEAIELYGERYPDMSLNEWRRVVVAYTPMIRAAAQRKQEDNSMRQYGMAAES